MEIMKHKCEEYAVDVSDLKAFFLLTEEDRVSFSYNKIYAIY